MRKDKKYGRLIIDDKEIEKRIKSNKLQDKDIIILKDTVGGKMKIKIFMNECIIDFRKMDDIEIDVENHANVLYSGRNNYIKINGQNNMIYLGENSSVYVRNTINEIINQEVKDENIFK